MKALRKFGLGLLALGLGVGLFFLFESQTAGAIIFLVLLLLAQLSFLLKRIRLKQPVPPPLDPARVAGVIQNIAQAKEQAATAKQVKETAKPAPSPEEFTQDITPSLFSQFQKNLVESEKTPPPPKASSVEEEGVVVRIGKKSAPSAPPPTRSETPKKAPKPSLIQPVQGKNPYQAVQKKQAPRALKTDLGTKKAVENRLIDQVPTEPIGELFADLEEEPVETTPKVHPKPRKKQGSFQLEPAVTATKAKDKASPPPSPSKPKRPSM